MNLVIPHGGSGHGISYWSRWMTSCLIRKDMEDAGESFEKCGGARLKGTMFHVLMDQWHKGSSVEDLAAAPFVDEKCGPCADPEIESEARRMFADVVESEIGGGQTAGGRDVRSEVLLSGTEVSEAMGISPFTALLDLVVERDNGIWIRDYKTTSRNEGDKYGVGQSRLQVIAYWMAAEAAFGDIAGFEIFQVVPTKTVQINIYPQTAPWGSEREALKSFLANAFDRKLHDKRRPILSECQWCPMHRPGLCEYGL